MGITASTAKSLNICESITIDNSGISTVYVVNTGNKKIKNFKNIYNDTYTLQTNEPYSYEFSEINARLSNYYDAIEESGSAVGSVAAQYDAVHVFGHPDKWIFDYAQDYSNCGVNSCLNILAMAGIKDVVEVTPEYAAYLSTPVYKTQKEIYWNGTQWEERVVTKATYPKAPTETEDSFLLWAVQNSKNDEESYLHTYNEYYDNITAHNYVDSYTIHSQNYETYKTIKDLQASPLEVGGTYIWMQSNILNYWGVSNKIVQPDVKIIAELNKDSVKTESDEVKDTGAVDLNGNKIYERVTTQTTISYSEHNKVKTTTVVTTTDYYVIEHDNSTGNDTEKTIGEPYVVTEITEEIEKNRVFYDFAENLCTAVKQGKGIVLGGFANAFIGGKGGGHAITVVGVVENQEDPNDQTVVKRVTIITSDGGKPIVTETKEVDILGFYVVDTGGFLNPSRSSNAQFVSVEMLYNFITDTTYNKDSSEHAVIPAETAALMGGLGDYVLTDENIRKWADDLNLIGNNRKNVLEGNRGNNIIKSGNGNDVIYGGVGNDKLYGENDKDTIYGGAGNDLLTGGKGDDLYVFRYDDEISHDTIVAGSGRDSIQFDGILLDDLKYTNDNGNLFINYGDASTLTLQNYFKKSLYSSIHELVEVEMKKNDVGIMEIVDVRSYDFYNNLLLNAKIQYNLLENKTNKVTGTKLVDEITGGNKNDTISAGAGDDILTGGAGNDSIKAGAGKDIITASYGNDKIYGEAGDDVIIYTSSATGNDTIYSGKDTDHIEMKHLSKSDVILTRQGNNLVMTYDTDNGSSITIANYFNKKGKTSVRYVEFSDGYLDLANTSEYNDVILPTVQSENNANRKINLSKSIVSETIEGGNGFDTLTGGKAADVITGGLGNDVIYGGNGNDVIDGGLGNDKLYGQNDDNTYVFNNYTNGNDTIYTSGKGKTTLDFTSLEFSNDGVVGAYNDGYSYTKTGNDLIINYATDLADYDNSSVRISNFFKSKNEFTLIDSTDNEYDLKQATIYFKGVDDKKNKITGSSINDYIVGGDLNDTLKGAAGNDTIVAGLGNDNITGGAGNNTILYSKGSGNDVINLTKGEKLDIKLTGFTNADELSYKIVKKDLVISYVGDDKNTYTLTLKNFGTKDVTNNATKKTENDSYVKLYLDDNLVYDLREGNYLPMYSDFTTKKYKYTGNWHSETITAVALNETFPSKDRGASINGGAGNDIIVGCKYNDTIKGGDGNDTIVSGLGNDKVDGGNGNDGYLLFYVEKELGKYENVTITDTGKNQADIDLVELYTTSDDVSIWFNMDKTGKATYKFNVEQLSTANSAIISGVEIIVADGADKDASNDLIYDYSSDALKESIISFFESSAGLAYKDVNDVMKNGRQEEIQLLMGYFNGAWTTV